MDRLQDLQCDVVPDSAGDGQDISSEMTDSALGPEYDEHADQESTESPNSNEPSATASNLESDAIHPRTDSGCFTSPEEGVPSMATTRNGKVHTMSPFKNEFKDMSIVGDIEEAKRLSNVLQGLMEKQQRKGSPSLTSKVFCKRNFTMAIVGEAGCRLFFPDASLFLEVPKGALAKETVIYVFKPINGEPEQRVASKVVRYGPRLHCGTEETTFLHPVKLSVTHYAQFDKDSTKFTVRKCENAQSPWNILPTEDSTIRERTVDVMLSSFSIVDFVFDEGDIEAAPIKKMACIFGILRTGGVKVALVYLVDDDVAIVQLIEDHLKAKGCREEDITILPHVPVDPRTDVTFTVIGSDNEKESVSFKLSSLQRSHLSFDLVSDAAEGGADRINVSQSETILAVWHIWNDPIGNQGLHVPTWASSPQQADGEFGFKIPTPIPPDERPADTTHICNSLGFEVYDGRIEHQGDNAVSCVIEGVEDETLPVGYVPPLAFNRNRRRSSIAGIPSVPTIREDSGALGGANIVPLPAQHAEFEEPEVLPQHQRGRMTRRATIDAGLVSFGSAEQNPGRRMIGNAETLQAILTSATDVFAISLPLPTQRGGTFPKVESRLQFNKGRRPSCPVTCPY